MREEGLLFTPVREVCKGPVVTCDPDTEVVAAARLMDERGISGVVAEENGVPVGVFTDRDLRRLVARAGGQLGGVRVREAMHSPVLTVSDHAPAYEAVYLMARHNIHRLLVVDATGRMVGVITGTDILGLQTNSPLYLRDEVARARSLEDLKRVNARVPEMVRFALRAGAGTRDLVGFISQFNDEVSRKAAEILEAEGVELPPRAAYLVLGSEGRGEQTLRTDQDSAAVFADDLDESSRWDVERFCVRLVETLVEIGVPPCPGGTMASNAQWRHPLSEWMALVEQWITVPTGEHMVNFGMFQDLRALWGDASLERRIKDHILELTRRHSLFFPRVAKNIVRFPPPLGWFGRIRTERRGKAKGRVDLKKAGIFALTEGVSLLALEAGILDGTTWDKIEALRERGVITAAEADRLDDAFTTLVGFRLRHQVRNLSEGRPPDNYLDPLRLTPREKHEFKRALEEVGWFLQYIRSRYRLDFIR